MRIFYSLKDKHLIVTPLRNGSTHLNDNMSKYDIINVTHLPIFKSVIQEANKKTFIYRDPYIRLLSFYNKFIYEPYKTSSNAVFRTKENDYIIDKFKPIQRGEDCISDLIFAKNKIEKNFEADPHTSPQYSFFQHKDYNQNIKDYEIISVEQYIKWVKLTFGDITVKQSSSSIDKIVITPSLFGKMQTIVTMCNLLYQDDYKIIEPKITYI